MKPYYQDDAVTIYHGDCREILPSLPSVDLVLTDPPYVGLKGGYDLNWSGGVAPSINSSPTMGDKWNADYSWISEDIRATGAMVFCSYHSVDEIAVWFKELRFRKVALLTWYKRNSAPTGKNVPALNSEFIWCFAKSVGLSWDKLKTSVFDVLKLSTGCIASSERILNPFGQAAHPTQKPLSLIHSLLEVGGDTILDPFMGSGTTLRAAKDLGRKAIGIEIEERYCEIAAKRMAQEVLPLGDACPRRELAPAESGFLFQTA